jgi:hypothetical protein
MTLTLYRVNTAGQGLGNLDANEQIIFNNTTNINLHNAFVTGVTITNTTGIGNNQAAEQDLGDHQDLGSVEQLYIIRGFISLRTQASAATNYIDIMKKWDDEVKTNDNFVHGRFGIVIDDFVQYNIVPDGVGAQQVGLIWKSIRWGELEFDMNPLKADFEIHLIVDRGDDQ